MARRCTATLLMMAYVASQLAMVSHAHGASGENQPSDHNARPHFHVSWVEPCGHSHGDGHVHDDECDGSHSHRTSADATTEQDDHDSDAVYLPNGVDDSLRSQRVASPDNLQVAAIFVIASPPTAIANSAGLAEAFSLCENAPACPRYLALRVLRI